MINKKVRHLPNLRSDNRAAKGTDKSKCQHKEEFNKKLAAFEIVKAQVEAFVAADGDLKSPAAAPLGVRLYDCRK